MNSYRDSINVVRAFAEAGAEAKTVSSWNKKKIPIELRKKWYNETVVLAIATYNDICADWLKENVK